MRDIILVGIQGSGKGTQVKRLVEIFGYYPIQTGKFFRSLENDESPQAQEIRNLIDRGEMVPDEFVMTYVKQELDKVGGGVSVIYDGVPRTELQRSALEEVLMQRKRDFHVVCIELDDAQARERLIARAELENRADDHGDAIDKRIATFHGNTQPMISAWEKAGRVTKILGEGSIEEVADRIDEALRVVKNIYV